MNPEFKPLFSNPHLATIAGNFWRRPLSLPDVLSTIVQYKIDASTTVVAVEERLAKCPVGNVLFLHGLEGSAQAGYVQSMSTLALERGYTVHRLNLRSCGGTEALSTTMYHSGLCSDTWFVINAIAKRTLLPVFLVGFSLGGNVALKLAGELGSNDLLAGTVAVSAPIDLATCVQAIDKPSNRLYAWRFVSRLKARIRRKSISSPDLYSAELLDSVHSIWQFDHRFTAPLFGFGTAANYYATQSAINYVRDIQSPTLLIAAQDDPIVPVQIYDHPFVRNNPHIQLVAPKNGGHIGFISRSKPRFWIDHVVMEWIQALAKA